ncbi:MAG: metal-dependent hydrolase [Dehalococcoidia bacterium]|nr:metal-dependent hydrolase [Dehalococcoidia bacterium]
MKQLFIRNYAIGISIFLLLSLLACAGPKPTPIPAQPSPQTLITPAPSPTQPTQLTLQTPSIVTVQPSPSPSPTQVTPLPTPTAAPTAAPTPTLTATRTPTSTASLPAVPSPTSPISPPKELSLQWFGQATFILTSSQGTKVLIDPTSPSTGYSISPINGVDVITVGHEHGDHNNVSLATGTLLILRGLSASGWNDIYMTVKDISIRSVATYHDSEQGAKRGRNTVFIFQVDSLRVVHLSDLGHMLTPEQVQSIGAVDVLMIPVGGNFTIDASQATQVVQQLSPKIVIPMHYKTPISSSPIAPVNDFLTGKKVRRPNSNIFRVSRATLPTEAIVVVLNYQ